MCSSLDGSQNRAVTSTAAIFAQAIRSLPSRQQLLAQILKTHPAPQRQRQIHVAKPARALDADALQPNRHRQMLVAVIEQLRLLRCADQTTRKRACFNAAALVKFAKMRNRLLDHTPADPHAAHQAPIAVDLPVLLAESYGADTCAIRIELRRQKKIPKVGTTRPNRLAAPR